VNKNLIFSFALHQIKFKIINIKALGAGFSQDSQKFCKNSNLRELNAHQLFEKLQAGALDHSAIPALF